MKLALLNKAGFTDDVEVEWIVRGLENFELNSYLGPLSRYESPPQLLKELVNASQFIDRKASKKPVDNNTTKPFEKKLKCFKCKGVDHAATNCPVKRKLKCFLCNDEGHMASKSW